MIENYTLMMLCDKYQIDSKKLVNKNNNILDKGIYEEIDKTLNYLVNELKISSNNIEKCPSILYRNVEAIKVACAKLKEAGAKRALPLAVGGAFHSPLMEMARVELAKAIEAASVSKPICPVYQNVDAKPHTDPEEIKENLLRQLTSPVRWTQSVINMIGDGMTEFIECGPGQVLTEKHVAVMLLYNIEILFLTR